MFIAPLPRLIQIWVSAALAVLFSSILGQSLASGLGFLASSYFGGFLVTVHAAAAALLALVFNAASKLEPFAKKVFRRNLPQVWRVGLSLSVMILTGTSTFAMLNSSFATDNPSSFIACVLASTTAAIFSFQTRASLEKYLASREFRLSQNGLKSLRIYLATWASAISIAIIVAAIAVLPQYNEYNRSLWALFTLLNLLFCLTIGLVVGYLNFVVSASILRAYLTGTRFRGNKTALIVFRSLQILAGGMVLAYVFAPSLLPAETVILVGLCGSLVVWLVTFRRSPATAIET